MKTALLRAVSHDLRTPLASIKASVSGLRQADAAYTDEDRAELLAAIEEESDRLDRLVGNLLDASRLEAGAVTLAQRAPGSARAGPTRSSPGCSRCWPDRPVRAGRFRTTCRWCPATTPRSTTC